MAPDMYDDADCTAVVDLESFPQLVDGVFVGEPVFPAALALAVMMKKLVDGPQPLLPKSMEATVSEIIRRGWSFSPTSFASAPKPAFSKRA